MARKILYLPLDDRPCTYGFCKELSSLVDFNIIMPPITYMGKFLRTGKSKKISTWLRQKSRQAEALIISIDALAFGNLIASRSENINIKEAMRNLNNLLKIAKLKKRPMIYGFNVLMRTAPTSTTPREIELSKSLVELSEIIYNKIKFKKIRLDSRWWKEINLERDLERLNFPYNLLEDYLEKRLRNHRLNLAMIDWAKDGVFDFLLICLDDTKTQSLNFLEKDILKRRITASNLKDKVKIYTGTDEIGLVLLSHYAVKVSQERPRVYAEFFPSWGARVIPRYEDLSLKELVTSQIISAGGLQVANPETADVVLLVNAPSRIQTEASLQDQMDFTKADQSNYYSLLLRMQAEIKKGKIVSLADVAYSNGADKKLVNLLWHKIDITKLGAFSAWNTASNSIGTAIAQSVLLALSKNLKTTPKKKREVVETNLNFLFKRFLDDWVYQSMVRPEITTKVEKQALSARNLGKNYRKIESKVSRKMKPLALKFHKKSTFKVISKLKLKKIYLPWPRLFEIGIDCNLELKKRLK